MKRSFAAFALLLVCMLLLMPLTAVFAEGDVAATGAEEIDYSKFSPGLNLTDAEGNRTTAFSTGLSCGANGYTLFTGHDYSIDIKYQANDNSNSTPPVAELEIIDCDPEMKAKYLTVENGSVKVKAGDEKYSFRVLLLQNGKSTEQSVLFNVARYKLEFNDILLMGIGVYALLTAITGSGAMLRNEFVKDGMEDKFKKTVRIASAIVGIALLGVAAISIFCAASGKLNWLKYVLFGVAVAVLIGSLIIASRMTDKEKRAKAQATARTGGPTNSAAAFEFDEDEPTIDDVLEKLNGRDGGSSDKE